MYKLTKPIFDGLDATGAVRLSDKAFIPFDPDNTDYQAFLLWKAEGNVPTPADEGTQ